MRELRPRVIKYVAQVVEQWLKCQGQDFILQECHTKSMLYDGELRKYKDYIYTVYKFMA